MARCLLRGAQSGEIVLTFGALALVATCLMLLRCVLLDWGNSMQAPIDLTVSAGTYPEPPLHQCVPRAAGCCGASLRRRARAPRARVRLQSMVKTAQGAAR